MNDKPAPFYRYNFVFKDNRTSSVEIKLDPNTLQYLPDKDQVAPFWARLDYMACDLCPMEQAKKRVYCPVALNLATIIETFKNAYSYDVVDVTIETKERAYAKIQVPIQQALSSLLGIIMVTSGCKDLDKLRPMARFHLPFASIEETIYRATSMYLLAQYYRQKHNLEPDWDMTQLVDIYHRIDQINANICKRLQEASKKDASLNAVVILNVFAQMMSTSFESVIKDFEYLFDPYLK